MLSTFTHNLKPITLALLCVMLFPLSAHAGLMLKLTDGISTVTISDGGIGDSSATAGVITYVGSLGSAAVNVTTGSSKPATGSAAMPSLNLTDFTSVISADTSLTVWLTDTDFSGPTSDMYLSSISKTDSSNNSYKLSTYLDSGNSAFGTATALATNLMPSGGVSAGIDHWTSATVNTAHYSLTMKVDMSLKKDTTAQFNSLLQVPEPNMLSLLGLALAMIAAISYRKHRRHV